MLEVRKADQIEEDKMSYFQDGEKIGICLSLTFISAPKEIKVG